MKTFALTGMCFVIACTSSSATEGPLVPLTAATSSDGTLDVTLMAPEAITRGNYMLQYIITTTADGAAADGLDLALVPWMPAMGHGTSIVPTITGLGSGIYELDDVDLFMAGTWQLRTTSNGADLVAPQVQVE